eukprot:CFRG7957T1
MLAAKKSNIADTMSMEGFNKKGSDEKLDSSLREFCLSIQGCVVDLSMDTERRLYFQSDVLVHGKLSRLFLLSDLILIGLRTLDSKSTVQQHAQASPLRTIAHTPSGKRPFKLIHYAPLFNVKAEKSSVKGERLVIHGLSVEPMEVEVVKTGVTTTAERWIDAINMGSIKLQKKLGTGSISAIHACLLLYKHHLLDFSSQTLCVVKSAPSLERDPTSTKTTQSQTLQDERLADDLHMSTLTFTTGVREWHKLNDKSPTSLSNSTKLKSTGHLRRFNEVTEELQNSVSMYACETRDKYAALNKVIMATVKMADHVQTDVIKNNIGKDDKYFLFDADESSPRFIRTFSRRGSVQSDNIFITTENDDSSDQHTCSSSPSTSREIRRRSALPIMGCEGTYNCKEEVAKWSETHRKSISEKYSGPSVTNAIGRVQGKKVMGESKSRISITDTENLFESNLSLLPKKSNVKTTESSDNPLPSGSEQETLNKYNTDIQCNDTLCPKQEAYVCVENQGEYQCVQCSVTSSRGVDESGDGCSSLSVNVNAKSSTGRHSNKRLSGILTALFEPLPKLPAKMTNSSPVTKQEVGVCLESVTPTRQVRSAESVLETESDCYESTYGSWGATGNGSCGKTGKNKGRKKGRSRTKSKCESVCENEHGWGQVDNVGMALPNDVNAMSMFSSSSSKKKANKHSDSNSLTRSQTHAVGRVSMDESEEESDTVGTGYDEVVVGGKKKGHSRTRSLLVIEKIAEAVNNPSSRKYRTTPLPRGALNNSMEFINSMVSSPKNAAQLSGYNPRDVCAQLCVRDTLMLGRIMVSEFQDCVWSKRDKKYESAPNISAAIEESNRLAMCVPTEVLSYNTPGGRARCMERFIQLAACLFKDNNFNSLKMVLCGLSCQAVFRIRQSWALVSDKSSKKFEQLQNTMAEEHNYRVYRETLKRAAYPKIPYLGVYLTDITMTSDAFKNADEEKHLVVSKLVQEFRQSVAESKYNSSINIEIAEIISDGQVMSDEEAYQLSLKCEPPSVKSTVRSGHRAPTDISDCNTCTSSGRRFNSNEYKGLSESTLKAELARLTDEVDRLNTIMIANPSTDSIIPEADIWAIHRHITYIDRQLKIITKEREKKLDKCLRTTPSSSMVFSKTVTEFESRNCNATDTLE